MSKQKAFERGLEVRRKVLGAKYVERSIANTTPFNADFQELITRHAWDDIWTRPGLPRKARRMVVIAQLLALGAWDEFSLHVTAALETGDLTQEEIKEILLQSTIYCGVPAANQAFKDARVVIDSLAAAKPRAKKSK